jgi:type I restriction enzyme, S subunit
MGRYRAYPEYKDSGIDWLREVPSHWGTSYLGFECSVKARLGWRGLKAEEYVDEGYIFLATPNIKGKEIDFINVDRITKERYEESPEIILLPGDVLVTKDGSTTGTTNVVRILNEPATVNSSIAVLRSIGGIQSLYLYYFFESDYTQNIINRMRGGMGVPHLFQADLRKFDILVPLHEEQVKIANFLDHETAKIDTLIEKQQQLIKLLKEKRQAVISHAVTKGLNPDAPMRDSGVEWLGEVPVHWDMCLIKHKCEEITDGAHVSPVTEGGEHYFVSITDIKNGAINFDGALLTSPDSYEYLIKTGCKPFPGDILFSKDGTIGQTAITPSDVDFVVASSLIIIRPHKDKVLSYYLDFLLQSGVVVEQVESFVKGAALRRLSIQNLLKVWGVFPPLSEQENICSYLVKALSKYDEIEAQAVELIRLQQERRTALISAAVTGKIDVRGWRAPDQEDKENAT